MDGATNWQEGRKESNPEGGSSACNKGNLVHYLCAKFRSKLLILFCKREKNGENLVKEKNVMKTLFSLVSDGTE